MERGASYRRWISRFAPTIMVALSLYPGCGQKDPVGIEAQGSIFVSSDEPGATIILDGTSTSFLTPDTLRNVSIGEHEVAVSKDGFTSDPPSRVVSVRFREVVSASFALTPSSLGTERTVLLEDFSNTGCIPCVDTEQIIHDAQLFFGEFKLVVIQYHLFFPNPGDPFYQANVEENAARTTFYSVPFAPFIVVDGVNMPSDATNAGLVQEAIDDRIDRETALEIRVRNDIVGSSGVVETEIIAGASVPEGEWVLRCAVIENDIEHEAPNGINLHQHVMRDILPGMNGEPIQISEGDTITFSHPYVIPGDWNREHLAAVAFVQNDQTKEILQAASSDHP